MGTPHTPGQHLVRFRFSSKADGFNTIVKDGFSALRVRQSDGEKIRRFDISMYPHTLRVTAH